jgi:hypothetical protein
MRDAHEAVKRAGHDQRAISVEVYGGNIVEMGVQCFGASTCIEISIQGHKSLDNKLRAPFAAFHILTSPSQPPDTSCVPSVL